MTQAVIGLGSNLGDGRENLRRAWGKLGEAPNVRLTQLSHPYYSEPVGMDTPHWFTNAVGLIDTDLPPKTLLGTLLRIEAEMGRRRRASTLPSDRTIDLDLIYYDELISSTKELTVPHPELQNRLFVLMPLAELIPEYRHPIFGFTSSQMLVRLSTGTRTTSPRLKVVRIAWREQEVWARKINGRL